MYDTLTDSDIEELVEGIEGACANLTEAARFPMALDMTISALRNFGFERESRKLQSRVRGARNRTTAPDMFGAAVFHADIAPDVVAKNRSRLSVEQVTRIEAVLTEAGLRRTDEEIKGSNRGCLLAVLFLIGSGMGIWWGLAAFLSLFWKCVLSMVALVVGFIIFGVSVPTRKE